MPHGITLLTSPRNNDSYYLLFEQPFSGQFHATACASSYLWFPSHDLLALTKSTHCHFSSRLKGTNASSSSSYLHSWCSPHDSRFVTKSPVWNSHHECLKLSYSSFWTLKFFIAEIEFWLRIALIQIEQLPKGASTRPRVPYCSSQQNGLATLLASPFCNVSPFWRVRSVPGEVTQHLAIHISRLPRIYQVLYF